jgi:hypothetical protein
MSIRKKKAAPAIVAATKDYERWAATFTPLDDAALDRKHHLMTESPFLFLRATYYRWAQTFPLTCRDLCDAPAILAVGDVHVDNFGTWRDDEGRLAWGINDFDEAARLPYANDLVRLATSAKFTLTKSKYNLAVEQIEKGYRETIAGAAANDKSLVQPIVLADGNHWLEDIAVKRLRTPAEFWSRLDDTEHPEDIKTVSRKTVPGVAARLISRTVPDGIGKLEWKSRNAGVGSLGRPRYVAIAEWKGGRIAREAKALVPSAAFWVAGTREPALNLYDKIHEASIRSPDPYLFAAYGWVVRRLAPDSRKLLLSDLSTKDIELVFHAMGRETANVHLGTKKKAGDILKHIDSLPAGWLSAVASEMAAQTLSDYEAWKER